jgi:hypothetical protein
MSSPFLFYCVAACGLHRPCARSSTLPIPVSPRNDASSVFWCSVFSLGLIQYDLVASVTKIRAGWMFCSNAPSRAIVVLWPFVAELLGAVSLVVAVLLAESEYPLVVAEIVVAVSGVVVAVWPQ